ncbi:DUF6294 family protein [Microbispora sp. CA-135349]|uniref:DUF6294 family protein n=1 Tax=Microbispora sp. CA-135349 TaxID=3239953 RepID=UPI003D8A772A
MRSIRRSTVLVVTAGALALGLALPTGTAYASAGYKTFTWKHGSTAGDCTMYSGGAGWTAPTWTLYPDGTAWFDATLTSMSGDDAWLMWAHLKDENGALLADIRIPGSTSTKFVKNLPLGWPRKYRWLAEGRFDPSLYPLIKGMSLSKHC